MCVCVSEIVLIEEEEEERIQKKVEHYDTQHKYHIVR
jgi:hypothetical protein